MDEVAKHSTKTDCWVVVNGQVLDVTRHLAEHLGGEMVIRAFAGQDVSALSNTVHPHDVIPKYAPNNPAVASVSKGATSRLRRPLRPVSLRFCTIVA